ncbi:MAG TPA: hypothetical protein VJU84_14185 [Pyrinomonadaceae bacterium]|nr:hypothetical protein [Pyrinomonadaceae bacterium]
MPQFRYYKRTFLAPALSRTSSYIIAEIESSYEGKYVVGTNMLTIADCGRRIQLEFFLGNARDRQLSLAKAQLLADVINTFCAELREESKLIEKAEKKAAREAGGSIKPRVGRSGTLGRRRGSISSPR